MDSFTHIALGACMGEALAGKKIDKKAMLWGALAQSIPDIDFIASFWLDTPANLLAHRGFTHSILCCLLLIPLFTILAMRLHKQSLMSAKQWALFFAPLILFHPFVDAFNNYGVGWFEPFDHGRISFNSIYVADPFFSVWPCMALMALLILKVDHPRRMIWSKFGLGMAMLYLSYCTINKCIIDKQVQEIFSRQQIKPTRYFTTPAPLQNWLWFVVAGNEQGYWVGYHSIFDKKKEIPFSYFPRRDSLLQQIKEQDDLNRLIAFSQQYYTVDYLGDSLVFNDLRFGQVIGWYDPKEKFAFHYFLQYPYANKLVVQRGRFAKWNWTSTKALLKRIRGN